MFPRVLGISESRQSLEVKVFAPRKQRLAVRSAEIAVSTAFAPLPYPQPRLRCTSAPASGTVTANTGIGPISPMMRPKILLSEYSVSVMFLSLTVPTVSSTANRNTPITANTVLCVS